MPSSLTVINCHLLVQPPSLFCHFLSGRRWLDSSCSAKLDVELAMLAAFGSFSPLTWLWLKFMNEFKTPLFLLWFLIKIGHFHSFLKRTNIMTVILWQSFPDSATWGVGWCWADWVVGGCGAHGPTWRGWVDDDTNKDIQEDDSPYFLGFKT